MNSYSNILPSRRYFDNKILDLCLIFYLSRMITKPTRSTLTQATSWHCLTDDPTDVGDVRYNHPHNNHDYLHVNLQFSVILRSYLEVY